LPAGDLQAELFSFADRWSFQCTTWCQTRGFLQPPRSYLLRRNRC